LGAGLQAARTCLERAQVCFQFFDALPPRQTRLVERGELLTLALHLGDERGNARGRAGRFALGLLERVAQLHEIAGAGEHFLFEPVDFRAHVLGLSNALDTALRADDRVEEDHRPEAAESAIEEREAEDLGTAAPSHGRDLRRPQALPPSAVPTAISASSTPGSPIRTRSPARTRTRSATRSPLTKVPNRL